MDDKNKLIEKLGELSAKVYMFGRMYHIDEVTELTKDINELIAKVFDYSPWHTGTPTEAGDYYIAFRYFIGADVEYGWASWDGKGWDINFMGWDFPNKILAWHKIEPFKED